MRRSITIALAVLLSPISLADGVHKSGATGHVRPAEQEHYATGEPPSAQRPDLMFTELSIENETTRWVRVEVDGQVVTWLAPRERDVLRVSNSSSRVQTFVGQLAITTDLVRRSGSRHRQSILVTPPTVGEIEFTNNKRYAVTVYVDGESIARVQPRATVLLPAPVGMRRVLVVQSDGRHTARRREVMEERLFVGSYESVELETPYSRRSRAERPRR
jgi:hypothetical protein